MKSGAARKIEDIEVYKDQLTNRLDPSMSIMQGINAKIRKNPKRVIFAEVKMKICLKLRLNLDEISSGYQFLSVLKIELKNN